MGRKRDRSDREKKVREGEMGMGIVGGSFQFAGGKGFSATGRQEGLNGESRWRNEERRKKRPTGQLNF